MSDLLNKLIKNNTYPNYKILNYINLEFFYFENFTIKIDNCNNIVYILNSFDIPIYNKKLNNNIDKIYNDINIIIKNENIYI